MGVLNICYLFICLDWVLFHKIESRSGGSTGICFQNLSLSFCRVGYVEPCGMYLVNLEAHFVAYMDM